VDFNSDIFMGPATTPEQQAALAASLRNREQAGTIMSMLGDRALSPAGQELSRSAGADRQRAILQNYYRDQGRIADERTKEDARQADMMASLKRQQMALQRDLAQGKLEAPLAEPDKKKIIGGMGIIRSLGELESSWKPEWESKIPGMNYLRETLGRVAPGLASDTSKEIYGWRRKFHDDVESAYRLGLYGTAMSSHELLNWQKQALDPNATTEQVRQYAKEFSNKVQMEVGMRAEAAKVRSPMQISNLLSMGVEQAPQEQQGAAPTQQSMYEVVTD
jgi:hypothetical protein